MENEGQKNRGNKMFSWVLRGFLIFVAFLFMLFSFDVFGGDGSFWEKLGAFLIHNVFTFALLIILFIAWRWEHIAGLLLIGLGIFMAFFFGGPLNLQYGTWIMISLPTITGILFLCNYYLIQSRT